MKNLDLFQICKLRMLIDRKMDSLEQAIENKRTSPFTVSVLSEYAEIDAILQDMQSLASERKAA